MIFSVKTKNENRFVLGRTKFVFIIIGLFSSTSAFFLLFGALVTGFFPTQTIRS